MIYYLLLETHGSNPEHDREKLEAMLEICCLRSPQQEEKNVGEEVPSLEGLRFVITSDGAVCGEAVQSRNN